MLQSLLFVTAIQARHRVAAGLLLCLFGLFAGCKSNHYELQLQPNGPLLQRQLAVWVERDADDEDGSDFGEFSASRLRQIVAAYGVEMPGSLAARHEFQGEFAAQMPDDIGGDGFYHSWPSTLGTAYVYVEQFRGNDALNAGIAQRQLAANRAVDVILLWLETVFPDSGDLQFVLNAMDTKVRPDLLDLNAYDWLDEALPTDAFDDEALAVRLLHYMVKRGYFEVSQAPAFYHVGVATEIREDEQQAVNLMMRSLASRFGVPADEPLPAPLRAVRDDSERYVESFNDFLDNSDALRDLEQSWSTAAGDDVKGKAASAKSVLDQTIPFLFLDFSFDGGLSSKLNIELHTIYEPEFTNGEWDEERGVVSWDERLVSDHENALALPTSVYAMWVKPSVDFQLQHFGEVAIDADLLGEYCIWRNGLSARRGDEWDRFLESVESSAEFVANVGAFRFSDRDTEIAAAIAYPVIKELIEALE